MPKLVYDFAEGNRDMKELLGGKGANLAEMTNLGLPVPPGFTITAEACRAYLKTGSVPPEGFLRTTTVSRSTDTAHVFAPLPVPIPAAATSAASSDPPARTGLLLPEPTGLPSSP